MFHIGKKKKRYVTVCGGGEILYDGLLEEIPIKEEMILNYSIRFFQDPEPCYIHRGAVRIRIVEEMAQELTTESLSGDECPKFCGFADMGDRTITRIEFRIN